MVKRKKRYTFRGHIVLFTIGRAFLLLCLFTAIIMAFQMIKFSIIEKTVELIIVTIVVILIIVPLLAFTIWSFWPSCFGKLIVDNKSIKWKCIFMRTRKLNYDDCKYTGIKSFIEGNAVHYDLYKTGFLYFYISKKPFPNKRIDKIRCNNIIIKFQLTPKLCECLSELLPDPHNRIYKSQLRKYNKK